MSISVWRFLINTKKIMRQLLGKSDFIKNMYFKFSKKFDGYIRIYLTLECNLTCRYCVNQCHSKEKLNDDNFISSKKWIASINRENRNVIFTGGEPTLHPDFIEIINSINPKIRVKVYTNLIWSDEFTERYISELDRSVKLLVSYHPSGGKPEPFIDRILILQRAGKFNGIVHSVDYENQREFIKKARDKFKEAGIELAIDSDQEETFSEACDQKFKSVVECSKKIILISPDGTRYQCVSKLVRGINPLENMLVEDLGKEQVCNTCHEYGCCAPCDMLGDVKIKKL